MTVSGCAYFQPTIAVRALGLGVQLTGTVNIS